MIVHIYFKEIKYYKDNIICFRVRNNLNEVVKILDGANVVYLVRPFIWKYSGNQMG